MVVVLVMGAGGLVPLLAATRRRDVAAIALSAWVTWAVLATIASNDPVTATVGVYNWGTGLLFVVCMAATWALAIAAEEAARRAMTLAVLGGALVNAVAAAVQVTGIMSVFPFETDGGRAAGFLGNPVHLGAVCIAALILLALEERPIAAHAVAALALGVGIQASGSRLALALGMVALGALLLRRRWIGAALVTLALLGGVVIVALLPAASAPGSAVSSSRLTEASGEGLTARFGTWRSALDPIVDAPLLGAGPGRFRASTLPVRSIEVARAEGPERAYVDAHNLVVEYAVTTGPVGSALLVGALVAGLWRGRGPWRCAGAALIASHLFSPQSVAVTPVLFLALGLAQPRPVGRPPPRSIGQRATSTALVVVAASAGATLVVGDFHLRQARLDVTVDDAMRAERLLPPWPQTARTLATAHAFLALSSPDGSPAAAESRRWLEEAARRSPDDPSRWSDLGDEHLANGEGERAAKEYERALQSSRYSTRALNGLARSRAMVGDTAGAIDALKRSLDVVPTQASAVRLLRSLKGWREDAGPSARHLQVQQHQWSFRRARTSECGTHRQRRRRTGRYHQ